MKFVFLGIIKLYIYVYAENRTFAQSLCFLARNNPFLGNGGEITVVVDERCVETNINRPWQKMGYYVILGER